MTATRPPHGDRRPGGEAGNELARDVTTSGAGIGESPDGHAPDIEAAVRNLPLQQDGAG